MTNTDELSNFIMSSDHRGFLRCYMQLIIDGANLSIPTSLELPKIKDGWLEILPGVSGGYTDDFVEELSQYWLQIVKKQGGKLTESFADECLAIIEGRPTSKLTASQGDVDKVPAEQPSAPKPQSSTSSSTPRKPLTTVESNISSGYYKEQEARDTKPIPEPVLKSKVALALRAKAAESFLYYYLGYSRHQKRVKVPMSSVLSSIREQWNELLMREYSLMAEDDFLKELTSKWFFLVNHKGIPGTLEKLQEIFYYLHANRQDPDPEPEAVPKRKTKPKSWFKKLLKLILG